MAAISIYVTNIKTQTSEEDLASGTAVGRWGMGRSA